MDTQDFEMLWFVDAFRRRRLNEEIVACTKLVLKDELRRRADTDPIDVQQLFEKALTVGTALANGFEQKGLI